MKRLSPEFKPFKPVERPKVILTEGLDGKEVFCALLSHLGLIEDFEVRDAGGKDNLRRYLRALVITPGFRDVVSLGVVRDANTYPERAFQSVHDALEAAGLAAPEKPFDAVGKHPRTTIMILPNGDDRGELEDLLLKSVEDDPAMDCVEQYFECLKNQLNDHMIPKKLAKARAHAFLASRRRPSLRLGEAAQAGYWPWNNPAFDSLQSTLNNL